MFDKIKKGAQASIDASKKAAEVSMDASIKAKDQSIKYGKKYIRKKAIENIREKLEFCVLQEEENQSQRKKKVIKYINIQMSNT